MRSVVLVSLMLAHQAFAQDVTLATVPAEILPGAPFVLKASGTFPTPCSLDSVVDVDQDDGELVVTVGSEAEACIQVVSSLDEAFGPFEVSAASGDSVRVVLRGEGRDDDYGVIDAPVVSESGLAPVTFRSGIYWDDTLPGNGVALEVQGDRVFLGMLGYAADGSAQWQAAVATITHGAAQGDLGIFGNGDCVPCAQRGGQAELIGSQGAFQLVFEGTNQAFLTFGAVPARAMALQRFTLGQAVSEGTIAGVTFVMPDLTGQWLITDLADGQFHVLVDLMQVFSGISDSGLAFFADAATGVQVQCSQRVEETFVCDFLLDETRIFSAGASQIAHDQILTDNFVALKLN